MLVWTNVHVLPPISSREISRDSVALWDRAALSSCQEVYKEGGMAKVELAPFRPWDDFFPGSERFAKPDIRDLPKWNNRVVSNLLYYQTNYMAMAVIVFLIVGWVTGPSASPSPYKHTPHTPALLLADLTGVVLNLWSFTPESVVTVQTLWSAECESSLYLDCRTGVTGHDDPFLSFPVH